MRVAPSALRLRSGTSGVTPRCDVEIPGLVSRLLPLGSARDGARSSLEDLAGGGRATTIRSKTSRGLASLDKPVTLFVEAASDLPHYKNAGGERGNVGA